MVWSWSQVSKSQAEEGWEWTMSDKVWLSSQILLYVLFPGTMTGLRLSLDLCWDIHTCSSFYGLIFPPHWCNNLFLSVNISCRCLNISLRRLGVKRLLWTVFFICKANRFIDNLYYSDGDFSISVTPELSKDEHERSASVDNIIYPLVRWSLILWRVLWSYMKCSFSSQTVKWRFYLTNDPEISCVVSSKGN